MKKNEVLYVLFYLSPTVLTNIDLSGGFHYRSARGNDYIFVAYHYNTNAILAQSLKIRKTVSIEKYGRLLIKSFRKTRLVFRKFV